MSEKEKNTKNYRSIYISQRFMDFWNQMEDEAEEKGIGVGAHVCRELKKYKAMEERGGFIK